VRDEAIALSERYKFGPMFNPAILGRVDGMLGAVNIGNAAGGTNWTGGAYDPETHIAYAPVLNAGVGSYSLVAPPAGFSDKHFPRVLSTLVLLQRRF